MQPRPVPDSSRVMQVGCLARSDGMSRWIHRPGWKSSLWIGD